jgi:hypothetical protein
VTDSSCSSLCAVTARLKDVLGFLLGTVAVVGAIGFFLGTGRCANSACSLSLTVNRRFYRMSLPVQGTVTYVTRILLFQSLIRLF